MVCCREDGDQDGDVGELEGSNNSSGILSQSSTGPRQLESPLPPQSSVELNKQGNLGGSWLEVPDLKAQMLEAIVSIYLLSMTLTLCHSRIILWFNAIMFS